MAGQGNIPIFIPIKTVSVRCPNKNQILLPYTLDYIVEMGRIEDVIIIADSEAFKTTTCKYPIREYYIETRAEDSDELISVNNYLSEHPEIKEYLRLPVTQPCRDESLIDRILETNLDKYDMATSYITRQSRSIFEINPDYNGFIIPDYPRKGSLCRTEHIADGAIYYTTADFTKRACENKFRNYCFWNNNVLFVKNNAPLVDIDTPEDLELFLMYYRLSYHI